MTVAEKWPAQHDQPLEIANQFRKLYERPVVLEARDLDKVTVGPDGDQIMLQRVDLKVRQHEILGIVGPDADALRTLMMILAGHDFPTAGNVLSDGRPAYGPSPDRGILDQDFPADPAETVRDQILATLEAHGHAPSHAEHVGRQLVNMVGLKKVATLYPYTLEPPMLLRLYLALALASGARTILMIEPFAGMTASERTLWERDLLHVWRRHQVSIVFAGHDLAAAVYMADRLLVLDRSGEIVEAVEVPLQRPRSRDLGQNPRFVATLQHVEARL